MSVSYDVKEHISAKNLPDCCVETAVVDMLAQIGNIMFYDRACFNQLTLTADGKQYTFVGDTITPAYQEIIQAVRNATEFDLVMQYSANTSEFEFYIDNAVTEVLHEKPELADQLFYSLYNTADCACESNIGILAAFGQKKGILYEGILKPEVHSIPETGRWRNMNNTPVIFDDDTIEGIDFEEIEKCFQDFELIGAEIQVNKKDFWHSVDWMTFESSEQIQQFIAICSRLQRATKGNCYFCTEFVNLEPDDAQIMVFEFDQDGTPTVKIASVDPE